MRLLLAVLSAIFIATSAQARDQIRVVGSSTVFPFVAAASEKFSDKTGYKAPIVESIGTGAGFVEFCKGLGTNTPDVVNASREIKASEKANCEMNNVGEVVEIPIGMDGIVIASSTESSNFPLTREQLFKALAKEIPVEGKLASNPNKKWSDIDASLPDVLIEVYGPKSTSGTRDAFVELAMEPICIDLPEFVSAYPDKKQRTKACHMMREDGRYIEAGENDNLIVQKLNLNHDALGIFGFSYLDQNMDKIQAHPVDGVDAEFENIADGMYPIARTLFVYTKRAHMEQITGLKDFLIELTSEEAISPDGYLSYRGLIPHSLEKRQLVRETIINNTEQYIANQSEESSSKNLQ